MVLIGPYYLWNTGPMWPKALEMRNACRDTWWRNILYINKFWHDKEVSRILKHQFHKHQISPLCRN